MASTFTPGALIAAYTKANLGKAPDQATVLTLDALESNAIAGSITDAQAQHAAFNLLNNTTAVAVETYQFFTGAAPSAAGLSYLVNSTTNTTDLNDAYYAKFNTENRFINFSINLATGVGAGATTFKALYGNTDTSTVSFAQVVTSAYDKIIGNVTAHADAVTYFTRADNITYLKAFVAANTGLTSAADIDLGVKAALIGQILSAGTTEDVGTFNAATDKLVLDLSDGTLNTDNAAGVNILTAYPASAPGGVQAFTIGVDNLLGTTGDDIFNGAVTNTTTNTTLNVLDSVDGNSGVDILNITDTSAATFDPSTLVVKNIETLNLSSSTGLLAGGIDVSSWSGLTAANVTLLAPAAAASLTAAATTAVTLTNSKGGTFATTVLGGSSDTVTVLGQTTGAITVGSVAAAPTGVVTVANTSGYAGANVTLGAINVTGGTSVSVTETAVTAAQAALAATAANGTVTLSDVTVTGTAATTTVTVAQVAAAAAVSANTTETATVTWTAFVAAGTQTIGGMTLTATGAFTAAQAATVAGGGAVAGLTITTAPTAWTVGAAAGNTNVFTSTTPNANVTNVAATGSFTGAGNSAPTSVTVNGADATSGTVGVVNGAVIINDVNANHATKAGIITSVSLTNAASAAIASNSLASLTLAGTNAVTIAANVGNSLTSTALTLNLAGGTSSVTDTNAEIKTLTVNATANATLTTFTDANLTSLNVSGSKLLTLTGAAGMTGLTKVTVTGAGGLTAAGLNGIATLTKIDTTGATGATTVSIDATKVTYVGGAGVDSVTLVGALPAAASITLGAGNDRLLGSTAVVVSTATVIDGGDGIDAVASSLISVGNAAQFKNFEVLNLAETAGTFDINLLTASTIQGLELNGGVGGGTYSNVTTAQSLTVTGTASGVATLAFANVAGTTDAYTIGFQGAVAGTSATALAAVNGGTLSIAGVEAVTINSGGAFNSNTISLTDADARTLTVAGSQALTVGFTGAFGTAGTNGLSSIDASAATGVVTINTANTGISSTAGLTIKTGTGADVVTLDLAYTGSISVGAGKDTVNLGLNTGVTGTAAIVKTTITDIATADKIAFLDHGTEAFTATKVDVTGLNDLQSALDLAGAGDGSVNSTIKWFQYLGNTYVVENNTNDAVFGAGDVAVKLTGLIDLSTAAGNGTHILTLG